MAPPRLTSAILATLVLAFAIASSTDEAGEVNSGGVNSGEVNASFSSEHRPSVQQRGGIAGHNNGGYQLRTRDNGGYGSDRPERVTQLGNGGLLRWWNGMLGEVVDNRQSGNYNYRRYRADGDRSRDFDRRGGGDNYYYGNRQRQQQQQQQFWAPGVVNGTVPSSSTTSSTTTTTTSTTTTSTTTTTTPPPAYIMYVRRRNYQYQYQ